MPVVRQEHRAIIPDPDGPAGGTGRARLTYDVAAERLSGIVGATAIELRVCSGGHRGATDPARWRDTPESRDQTRVGGPIPWGRYTVVWLNDHVGERNRRAYGRCCFLHPDPETRARIDGFGRVWNDFLIHRPSPGGSEGCLIPIPHAAYDHLMDLLQAGEEEPVGTLVVPRL